MQGPNKVLAGKFIQHLLLKRGGTVVRRRLRLRNAVQEGQVRFPAADLAAIGDQAVAHHLPRVGAEAGRFSGVGDSSPTQVDAALLIDVAVVEPADLGVELDVVPDDPIDHGEVMLDQTALGLCQSHGFIHKCRLLSHAAARSGGLVWEHMAMSRSHW